ncbi:sigma-54 dependent transcriptional regulator [Paracoccaceae bacterium]|nr:sigma-54 dependent transcriptional regulator [Paracoccaceae bacterium]
MDGTVLVADDDRTIRTVLTQALTRAGCRVHATSSLTTLMRWVAEGKGDTIITDVIMPDGNGLEMLPKIATDRSDLPVIVISAQNTIMTAIQAADAKAFDYLPKPFDLPDLMKRVAKALEQRKVSHRSNKEKDDASETENGLPLVGKSAPMQGVYRLVARLMNTDLPILVSGESGTGKSLVARVLHSFSDRRNLPFVTVSPADLIEIDGPAKILAKARGGSLIIEEISDFSLESQSRLVQMIDNPGEYYPRFIATTKGRMIEPVENGKIRSDVFYRLSGATIELPNLRECVDDILVLSEHFLKLLEKEGGPERKLGIKAQDLFLAYSWPGNVRQLQNVVKRLGLTSREHEISLTEVEQSLENQPEMDGSFGKLGTEKMSGDIERHLRRYFDLHGNILPPVGLYNRILKELEIPLISLSLEATGGNQARCADLLGINRNTLRKKINDLDIKVHRRRKLM